MNDAVEAIRAIAREWYVGHSGRLRKLPRKEMINRARDACDRLGIYYGVSTIAPLRADKAKSAPKHENYRKRRTAC